MSGEPWEIDDTGDVPWEVDDTKRETLTVPKKPMDPMPTFLRNVTDFGKGLVSAPARLSQTLENVNPVFKGGQVLRKSLGIADPTEQLAHAPDSGYGTAGALVGDVGIGLAVPGAAYSNIPRAVVTNAAVGAALAPDDPLRAGGLSAAMTGVAGAGGKVLKQALGVSTGAGPEAIGQAFKAGREGNKVFTDNMRNNVDPGVVVEQAKQGLYNIRQNMQKTYSADKDVWAVSAKPVNFQPIDDAYDNLVRSMQVNGMSKIGPAEQRVVDEIGSVISQWKSIPEMHTAEGLDALKQRINAIHPDDFSHSQAARAISTMTNSVKNAITSQVPEYAGAMRKYWESSQLLDEIERSLSIGDKPTVDTALRKLQSLMRNNVNSNFGQRVKSAGALKELGGEDIMPAVAGQALNSFTPRGLQGAIGTGVGLIDPSKLLLAPILSPRIVGEAAYNTGAGINAGLRTVPATVDMLRNWKPKE